MDLSNGAEGRPSHAQVEYESGGRDPRADMFVAERPWGDFRQFVSNETVTVKIITVTPGHRLSLQKHGHRGELWQILDVPMDANYGDESSNLQISRIFHEFLLKHCRNFAKRIFYSYFLRDMSAASLELVVGLALLTFGVCFGGMHWIESLRTPLCQYDLRHLPLEV